MKGMNIEQAPVGINVVVELSDTVFIGRLRKEQGNKVEMHHAAVHEVVAGEDPENYIRAAARYGVPVEHEQLLFEAKEVQRVRRLGEVPKA